MATMQDVADQAGVSITTVSHVINETRYVSPELVDRVWDAVESLNYRPNALARGLRRNRTHTIGMIVPDNANSFFAEIARKIEDACFELDYNVILCNSDRSVDKEAAYVDVLIEKQVDGILFVASGDRAEHLQAALDQSVPVVLVDREVRDIECDTVLVNNKVGGHQATEHLIERGHTRIACIAGPSDVTPSWGRVRGYRESLKEAGIAANSDYLVRGDFRPSGGYEAMQQLLTVSELPTALFACNDLMAVGAIRAIREHGLSIPDDIAIVGFDDIPLAAYTTPGLTTVAQPLQEVGQLATELLIERVLKRDGPPQRCLLETELVVRESS